MKDFRLFNVYDFLMDDDFIRWVRLRRKEDTEFWNQWLAQHPGKHMVIAEAKSILETLIADETVLSEAEKETEIQRLLFTIKSEPVAEQEVPVRRLNPMRKAWYIAASFFIILAVGTGYYLLQTKKTAGTYDYAAVIPQKRLIENVNTSDKAVKLRLPDESVITLSPNSRIAYSSDFDSAETRDIYLLGEAVFTVTKNPSRPFRVFANEIVTKVLGTSFLVRSFENDSTIKVVVKTGKVSVYSQASAKETSTPNQLGGIILTPNQELVYKREIQKFQKILLENPAMVVPDVADKNLNYEEADLETVFSQLSKNYGVNIVFDGELLKNCTITADLRMVPFFEKLDLICKAIGAGYEVIDGQVVIQSSGCDGI